MEQQNFHAGQRLAQARKLRSLSQEGILGEEGFPKIEVRSLQHWEKDGNFTHRIKEVADFFNVPAWVFLDNRLGEEQLKNIILDPSVHPQIKQELDASFTSNRSIYMTGEGYSVSNNVQGDAHHHFSKGMSEEFVEKLLQGYFSK